MEIKVKLDEGTNLPFHATSGSSGGDLFASEKVVIPPGEVRLINTGIRMSIPEGYEGQIRPRSGMAVKFRVTVINSPATIDSDYRGILRVPLINHSDIDFVIGSGARIAQIVICPVMKPDFVVVDELDETERGEGGFGSTDW